MDAFAEFMKAAYDDARALRQEFAE